MPGKYFDYYTRVADRILPFLRGRQVAIEQKFPGSKETVYRRHTGGRGDDTWIRIPDEEALIHWAYQYAVGLHGHVRAEDDGAWFVIDIDSRELPTEMARLAAVHAADVLAAEGLDALIKFSGSDGYHLMWDAPDLSGLSDAELWELERAVVRAVACVVERSLQEEPAAAALREAVGAGNPLITTSSADRENPHAILFDEYILKDAAPFRVPFSVHPRTGLVAVPLDRPHLATFRPEEALPDAVAESWPAITLPSHTIEERPPRLAVLAHQRLLTGNSDGA